MEPFRPEPVHEDVTASALRSDFQAVDLKRLGLTLSGGGFRATLFHLGVVRLLHDLGWLPSIKRIGAVSGGSILAAHLVLNWERYTGNDQAFDAAAQEILDFTRSDLRGRVVRRWILAWLTLFPRLLKRKHWTFTNLLQRFYARLYKDATLEDLLPTPGVDRPQVFFYCTSLSTGSVCSFGRSGFMWDEEDIERSIVAPMTPVAFAVAASSAFPPLFPPIAVSHEVLSCDRRDFPNVQYLTDGGVYDNLGIDRLIWYHKRKNDLDGFLISDAEGNFDWDLNKKYTFITTRNIRASALLMKRVSKLEYDALAPHAPLVVFDIDKEVQKPGDMSVLPPEVQRSLRNVRTDLDVFSPQEASSLIRHGYTVAGQVLMERGLLTGAAPALSWQFLPQGAASRPNQAHEIRRSRYRKWRLWSPRDWASWASLLVIAAVLSGLFIPAYLKQRRLAERAALSEELKEVNQKLTNVAISFYKQRHRPVEPGMSAGHFKTTAGTICCIVRLRGGGPQRFLLGGTSFTPLGSAVGDLILQPGRFDGGHAPEDVVARLYRILPLDLHGSNSAVGAIAEISPGIGATNTISGLGPIRGVADSLSLGQEVFVAGRTTGIAKAVVTSLDSSVAIQFDESAAVNFTNLVELKVGAGGVTKGGDSGAPVLTTDGKLAGMAFAGSTEASYAVPIGHLFNALGVELDMPRFRCLAGTITAQGGTGSVETRNTKCQSSLAPDGAPPNGILELSGLSYSWISNGIPCSCTVSM